MAKVYSDDPSKIDWSKAPEGTEYWAAMNPHNNRAEMWIKVVDGEHWFLRVDSPNDKTWKELRSRHHQLTPEELIPRPVATTADENSWLDF